MRNRIITLLKTELQKQPHIHACWLEGSDGLNQVDAYSDLDVVLDVDDHAVDGVYQTLEKLLKEIAPLDMSIESQVGHPKIRTHFYHLEGTSEYLILDISIQCHSRAPEESHFYVDDKVEVPLVLFDKSNIIQYKQRDMSLMKQELKDHIANLEGFYQQHARVIKYIRRGHFLEAQLYFNKYVASPITDLYRIIHIPEYYDLFLIHISDHLPEYAVLNLEQLHQNNSLASLEANIKLARQLYPELLKEAKAQVEKY